MSNREVNTNTPNVKGLSPLMVAALTEADARWDDALTCNRTTWAALYHRGLVDLLRGLGTGRHGQTAYNVVTGVYINDAGRAVIKGGNR